MSRHVTEVLKSGYLTAAEQRAIAFEKALEANEELMAEGAALAVTCEQFGIEIEDYAHVLIEIPDGDWWEAESLPLRTGSAA